MTAKTPHANTEDPGPTTTRAPAGQGFSSRLLAPVDVSSLVFFRIAFGALMVWEMWRFYTIGYIEAFWVSPEFHFTYYGFDWVQPWPGNGVYWQCLIMAILGAFIVIGFHYRLSCFLFSLGFSYLFLLEQARYVNHFYLTSLISFLLTFVPAHGAFSVDAWRKKSVRSQTAPTWSLWLLRAQIGIVYFYSGFNKLDLDWLAGEPIRDFLVTKAHWPVVGDLFYEEWFVYLGTYASLFVTLGATPLLLWKRSRPYMFTALVLFHLSNSQFFHIGIFPFLAIGATTLFFEPDWPRRLINIVLPASKKLDPAPVPPPASSPPSLRPGQQAIFAFLACYLLVQALVPLRHFLYPGNLQWTEEGQKFSWHLKSRAKSGSIAFFIKSSDRDDVWTANPYEYLTVLQVRKMAARPGLILQFSHYLAERLEEKGYRDVEVRVLARASLNNRPPQLLIDPAVDLAAQPRTWRHDTWLVPLVVSLPERSHKALEKQKKNKNKNRDE